MIDIHKYVIRYYIEDGVRYVSNYVINATSLQMARISLLDCQGGCNYKSVYCRFCIYTHPVNWTTL